MGAKNTILFLLLFLFANVTLAQDKLLLTNGHVERGKLLADSNGVYQFQIYKNGGKTKLISFEEYRVFSKYDIQGNEKVVYQQDSAIGNFLTVNEMRMYIYGQRDANQNFNAGPHFMLSYVAGLSFSIFDTYSFSGYDYLCPNGLTTTHVSSGPFHSEPTVSQILIPFVFAVGSTLIKSKIKKEHVSDIAYLSNEQYIEGFKKVKKFNKLRNVFIGSIAGVATGLIGYYASGGVPINCP